TVTTSPSKKTLRAAEQDRPDIAAGRAALKAQQPKLDAPRLVFIDETGVTTKMVRHYGRSPCGKRLVASVPHGHWKTLTLVAALRVDRMTAPYTIDGAIDGRRSSPMWSKSLHQRCTKATSSLWTTCAPTKLLVFARRSRPWVRNWSICPPTRPTSTPSSRHSPS